MFGMDREIMTDSPDETGRKLELYEDNIKRPSWLKRAYKEEWPTMVNDIISTGFAIGLSSGVSHLGSLFYDSDAGISAAATAADTVGYWSTFIPQLMYRDRNKVRNPDGSLSSRKMLKKAGEYLSCAGIIEGCYVMGSFAGQYYLQKEGWDPVTASTTVRVGLNALLAASLPPLRYALRHFSEK